MKTINKHIEEALAEWSVSPCLNMSKIKDALELARKAHGDASRKSGELFLHHPIRVALRAGRLINDDATIIAALLHDTVEDTEITSDELAGRFGKEVSALVDSLTKVKKSRVLTLQKLFKVGSKDVRTLIIKICDRLDNLDDLSALSRDKQKRISNESFTIYAEIARGLGLNDLETELRDKAFKVRSGRLYAYLEERILEIAESENSSFTKIKDKLAETVKPINADLRMVMKRPHQYMNSKRRVFDLPGHAEIITATADQCFTAMGRVHLSFRCVPLTIRDYISNPRSNGWRGLVSEVMVDGTRINVRYLTPEMSAGNRFGILHLIKEGVYHHKQYQEFLSLFEELNPEQGIDEKRIEDIFESSQKQSFQTMTPKGRTIELDYGASILDFAFIVHTSLGLSCVGGKINGQFFPKEKKVREGDVIEIVTDKTLVPDESWQKYLVMRRGRKELIRYLHKKQTS